jgi:hypothetical protein
LRLVKIVFRLTKSTHRSDSNNGDHQEHDAAAHSCSGLGADAWVVRSDGSTMTMVVSVVAVDAGVAVEMAAMAVVGVGVGVWAWGGGGGGGWTLTATLCLLCDLDHVLSFARQPRIRVVHCVAELVKHVCNDVHHNAQGVDEMSVRGCAMSAREQTSLCV